MYSGSVEATGMGTDKLQINLSIEESVYRRLSTNLIVFAFAAGALIMSPDDTAVAFHIVSQRTEKTIRWKYNKQ